MQVRIASPCPARWEDMEGNARVRFCNCRALLVYNLSAMSSVQAGEFLQSATGRLCINIFRRHDGTIITEDCPAGVDRMADSGGCCAWWQLPCSGLRACIGCCSSHRPPPPVLEDVGERGAAYLRPVPEPPTRAEMERLLSTVRADPPDAGENDGEERD